VLRLAQSASTPLEALAACPASARTAELVKLVLMLGDVYLLEDAPAGVVEMPSRLKEAA